ncbi:thiamine-phosphate kinase [bacterium]|nr:thiamine-phosphate kinase [bacterium]
MTTESNPSFTPLAEIGEFKLIDYISQKFHQRNASSLKLIGDDSAQLYYGNNHSLVSTDMFVHGVHFDLDYFPLQHLGFKTVVASISDILAMNGRPRQIFISLALSNHFSVEMLDLYYEGVLAACEEYNLDLAGGDLTTINRGMIINVTAIGEADKEKVVYRNGAQPNDLVCVSGDLGAAYLGLQLLEREKKVYLANPSIQPELKEENQYLYQRFLRPDGRDDVIKFLADNHIVPTAMMDISDGLSSDIMHITSQSKAGVRIYEDKLPIHPATVDVAEEFGMNPTTCALNGGEDYELLFTISPAHYEAITKNKDISVIGHITAQTGKNELVTKGENVFEMVAQGWQSYGSNPQ